MTYHLAAFRLCSVGERSARFTDVTLDLTAPDGGGPRPADTVVWLRNGGGKSSLLSLFYALLLPRAIDFMGRAVKRSLTDYVDSGDTVRPTPTGPGTGSTPPSTRSMPCQVCSICTGYRSSTPPARHGVGVRMSPR